MRSHSATGGSPALDRRTLSTGLRSLTLVTSALFAALGFVLFLAPSWASVRFAWKVSPFVTMTIGGWCLGTAFIAWWAARTWRWGQAFPLLGYLWWFGVLEVGVVVWFRELLVLNPLAWLYLAALGSAVLGALVGVVDLLRLRPSSEVEGAPMQWWARVMWAGFVAFVGALAAVAAFVPEEGERLNFFPEALTPFSLRAFGAFFLALGLGSLPLLWSRTMTPTITFMPAGLGLSVPILAAAIAFAGLFDPGSRPQQLAYPLAYLAAVLVALAVLVWDRGYQRLHS
jgi:hypothetical protein